jgi:hypothetical protein
VRGRCQVQDVCGYQERDWKTCHEIHQVTDIEQKLELLAPYTVRY